MKASTLLFFAAAIANAAVLEERGMSLACYFFDQSILQQLSRSYAQSATAYCGSYLASTKTILTTMTPMVTSVTSFPLVTITTTPVTTSVRVVMVSATATIATTTITTTLRSGTTTPASCASTPAAKHRRDDTDDIPPPPPLDGQTDARITRVCGCMVDGPFSTTTSISTINAVGKTATVTAPLGTITMAAPTALTHIVTSTSTSSVGVTSTFTQTVTVPAATFCPIIAPPPAAPAACNGQFKSSGTCGCTFKQVCATRYQNVGGPFDGSSHTSASDYAICAALCDNNSGCLAFSYQVSTQQCVRLFNEFTVVNSTDGDWAAGGSAALTCVGRCSEGLKANTANIVKGIPKQVGKNAGA